MVSPPPQDLSDRKQRVSPALRQALERAVRRRVAGDEALDVVQATWLDVLHAAEVPSDEEEFRRFVFGVARHKVHDHFRRRARELTDQDVDSAAQAPDPLSERDLLRWAEGELPDSEAQHTFDWMLRAGDGEKLEHIARDANLPAPVVRKRVSRLRRFLRERWAAELLLAGLLLAVGTGVVFYLREERAQHAPPPPVPVPEPERQREPTPAERAEPLRRAALELCGAGDAARCIVELDRAKVLDPAGDARPEVVEARRAAAAQLVPKPTPSAAPVLRRPRATPSKINSTEPIPTAAPTFTDHKDHK